jgi:hypothetical protein
MDEVAFLKATVRAYRSALVEIRDVATASESHAAKRVLEELVKMQHRLDALKRRAPASLLPEHARKREGLIALEAFR